MSTVEGRPSLDERYGRSRQRRRRERVLVVAVAAGFAVALLVWLVGGSGLLRPEAGLDSRDLGYSVIDESRVEVHWQVTVDPGTDTACALQAMSERYGVVGWKVVELPAGQRHTRTFTETLRTSSEAVTGLIYECWIR